MRFRRSVILLALLALAGPAHPAGAQQTPPTPQPSQSQPTPSPCEAQNVVIAGYALEMANLKIRIVEYERLIKTLSSTTPAPTPPAK
jgi:hypothetical protein